MDANRLLNTIRIASPCKAAWSEMQGDDRTRFCKLCSKHVYNISAMPAGEAAAVIEQMEGRLCVRLYRRRDGTVLTSDCPVGVQESKRGRLRRVAAWAMMGLSAMVTGTLLRAYGQAAGVEPQAPAGAGVTVALSGWIEWVKSWLAFDSSPPQAVDGFVVGALMAPDRSDVVVPQSTPDGGSSAAPQL